MNHDNNKEQVCVSHYIVTNTCKCKTVSKVNKRRSMVHAKMRDCIWQDFVIDAWNYRNNLQNYIEAYYVISPHKGFTEWKSAKI